MVRLNLNALYFDADSDKSMKRYALGTYVSASICDN